MDFVSAPLSSQGFGEAQHTIWKLELDFGSPGTQSRKLPLHLDLPRQAGEEEGADEVQDRLSWRQVVDELLDHVWVVKTE